jgi:hypothetical protein
MRLQVHKMSNKILREKMETRIEITNKLKNNKHNPINKGDTTMSKNNMFSRIGVLLIAVALMLVVAGESVMASGTLAGTVISNQATVNYSAGSDARSATSNTVSLTVGYKVSINLYASSSSTSTVDSTILYKPFYIYNSGNYSDYFKMTVGGVPTGWTAQIYKDVNNDQLWDGGDSLITSGGKLYTDYNPTG